MGDRRPDADHLDPEWTYGIALRDAAKSFRTPRGVVHAVRGIDALLGPNGAGKSTTIDMMLGLARPDRGRVTPLSGHAYLRAKVVTGYAMALLTMAMLSGSALVLGVSLPAERWLVTTGLILVGLIPFAALGVLVGHLLTADTIGPALGGGIAGFLPSYWLVQASHVSLGASAWPATGWIVVGAWSVVLTVLAGAASRATPRAYERRRSLVLRSPNAADTRTAGTPVRRPTVGSPDSNGIAVVQLTNRPSVSQLREPGRLEVA